MSKLLSLVIAVAEDDRPFAEELKKHLQPLSDSGQLSCWSLLDIPAGYNRAQVIEEQCQQADLFLMLLSADFFVSLDYQQITEQARKRESEGLARIFPILLRSVDLGKSVFRGVKLLPRNEIPINLWTERDRAWEEITDLIGALLDSPQNNWPDPRNPYKGLRAFQREDAHDFFGRTKLVESLLSRLNDILASDQARLLAVIGPSGVGKSSVVLAGLLPLLEKEVLYGKRHWEILPSIKLGDKPLDMLAASLAERLTKDKECIYADLKAGPAADCTILHQYLSLIVFDQPPDSRVVLVIDQMEELFQPGVHPDERSHFLSLLLETIKVKQGKRDLLLVILTLRADFLSRIKEFPEFPEFYDLVFAHRHFVLPMLPHEIRQAIEEPAARVQVQFDEHLVDDILQDLQGPSGSLLPLLQLTLEQLFDARQGYRLTKAAYDEQIGGVRRAVERQAEKTYNGLPDDRHRDWVETIFLRLVNPGVSKQGTTRKREVQTNLPGMDDLSEKPIVQKCIDAFVSARLLTVSHVEVVAPTSAVVTPMLTIEVSHEAVLREWSRLRDWINSKYDDLRLQQDLADAVVKWERHQKASEWHYRGQQLIEAEEWAKSNRPTMREKAFLQAARRRETPSRPRKIIHWFLVIVVIAVSIAGIWWLATHPSIPDPTRVTNTQDGGAGSLRWCLTTAPANSTITADPTVRGTITLNDTLTISKSLTIKGPGENVLALRGPAIGIGLEIAPKVTVSLSALSFTEGGSANTAINSRTIDIEDTSTLHLDHVTIAHNHSIGIANLGALVLSNATISDNLSPSDAGGVVNGGTMSITHSTIAGNSSSGRSGSSAGGVANDSNGNMTISNSTISHNSSAYGVGGVLNRIGGSTIISNSTISNNSSPLIGGVDNGGTMSITHSTISDNSAPAIGGVGNSGIMMIANSTLTNNSSPGIAAIDTEVGGKTTLFFCTVAENPGKGIAMSYGYKEKAATVIMQDTILVSTSIVIQDPYSVFQSMGYNLVDAANTQFFQQAGDRIIQDPFDLFANGAVLGQNGGATQTIQIRVGSEAYDAIPAQVCHIQAIYDTQDHIYTDQLDQLRPGKGKARCDIGAYETQQ